MRSKSTSIRLDPETLAWLRRNGKPISRQLRDDLQSYRLLFLVAKTDGYPELAALLKAIQLGNSEIPDKKTGGTIAARLPIGPRR